MFFSIRKRTSFLTLTALALGLLLSAVASAAPAPKPAAPACKPVEVQNITLIGRGWNGLIVFTLKNPNPKHGLYRAPFNITVKDAAGKVIATNSSPFPGAPINTIYALLPGETRTYVKGIEIPEEAVNPIATVKVTQQWKKWPVGGSPLPLQILSPNIVEEKVLGEVKNLAKKEFNVELFAIFTSEGKIVGAGSELVQGLPAGETLAFEIYGLQGDTTATLKVDGVPTTIAGLQ